MLVDPNTGLPIEDQSKKSKGVIGTAIDSQNMGVGAVAGFGEELGVVPKNTITDQLLETIPGAVKSTAWNTYRGSRTIAYGAPGVNQISGFRATFSPKYLRQMPSYSALGGRSTKTANYAFRASKYKLAPPGGGVAAESYTPFNMLAKSGNYGMKQANRLADTAVRVGVRSRMESGKAATMKSALNSTLDDMAETRRGRAALKVRSLAREGEAFGIGTMSRVVTGDRMARGAMPTGNIMNFLGETDKELVKGLRTVKAARYAGQQATMTMSGMPSSIPLSAVEATGDDAARLAYASATGSVSGRISGFMSQVRMGNTGMDAVKAAEISGNKAFGAGIESAQRFMNTGGFTRAMTPDGMKFVVKGGTEAGEALIKKAGLKAGEKVTMNAAAKVGGKAGLKIGARLAAAGAVNAVPVLGQVVSAVMLADLAMDVGKLGVEVFKSGVDFAKDAAISYKGSINKGVMGMGYRDNTVAATSRARGVQAIQNSRLNARSALGSEAGAMHAHFG